MTDPVIVSERAGGKYTLDVTNGRHHYYADEPISLGSSDLGPTPFEYLCASLGSCTAITLRMYVTRKDWEVGEITVTTSHSYRKLADGETKNVFTRKISVSGHPEQSVCDRLVEIANKCPVHRMLEPGNIIETTLD